MKKFADGGDFAKWGVELGFAVAGRVFSLPLIERAAAIARVRKSVHKTAREFLADGASEDEAALYRDSFEKAVSEKLKAMRLGGKARINIKTASGMIAIESAR